MVTTLALSFSYPPSNYLNRWFGSPRATLVDLPNDVFIEEIFTRIDIQDIFALRGVNRRLHALTHESVIWKRLLRRLNISLPPLPPTTRHSYAALNNIEVERLLVRSFSLHKNLQSRIPEPFYGLTVEAFHHVQSMVILPGGKYLVASVRDETRQCYSIMIFVLDYRITGALALAKTDTPTKAYNLQAKYMTFEGKKGIMVAYTLRDTKHKSQRNLAGGINISEMSTETALDISVKLKYSCVTMFAVLDSLDTLSDPAAFLPGSNSYNLYALKQTPPFRVLSTIHSSSSLGPVCVEELFGAPYMIVLKGTHQIMFKNLVADGHSTLTCRTYPIAPPEDHIILKFRVLPTQSSILVIRKVKEQCALFEIYSIPFLNEHLTDQAPMSCIILGRTDVEQVQITDTPPLTSRHDSQDMDCPPYLTGQASRSISVFCVTGIDPSFKGQSICRISLVPKPWGEDQPLPRIPFPLPEKLAKNPQEEEAFIRKYATHFYEINQATTLNPFGFRGVLGKMRVLPGSNLSLLYWSADTIADCSTLTRLGVYITPNQLPDAPTGEEPESYVIEEVEIEGKIMKRKNARVKPLCVWEKLWQDMSSTPFRCMAWDETIGRLCLAHDNDSRIFVVDFAQAPRENWEGERLPLPVRLYENPQKSSFFDGKFFFNTKA